MPLKPVNDAVMTRLSANWTHPEIPIIPYDTIREPPPGTFAFVVVQFPVAMGVRPTLGRTFWEDGVVRLVLNVVTGTGLDQVLVWTDELAAIFRELPITEHLVCFETDGPVITDDIDDGQWISYSVAIRYRFQYEG